MAAKVNRGGGAGRIGNLEKREKLGIPLMLTIENAGFN
jgi:hypothetical protein